MAVRTVLAGVLLACTLAGCGSAVEPGNGVVTGVSVEDSDGYHGAVLSAPYQLPKATLTDSHGDEFVLRDHLDVPLTLVFFGYTKCPDICQAVMADLASAVTRLDPAEAEQVHVWFVTTDPARDDPATLRHYLDRFDPSFEGLTGPLDDIVAVADPVHVAVEKGQRLPSGGYEVVHGTPVLGVRPDGSVPILWTEGTSAAKLAEDLHRILTDGLQTPKQEG